MFKVQNIHCLYVCSKDSSDWKSSDNQGRNISSSLSEFGDEPSGWTCQQNFLCRSYKKMGFSPSGFEGGPAKVKAWKSSCHKCLICREGYGCKYASWVQRLRSSFCFKICRKNSLESDWKYAFVGAWHSLNGLRILFYILSIRKVSPITWRTNLSSKSLSEMLMVKIKFGDFWTKRKKT